MLSAEKLFVSTVPDCDRSLEDDTRRAAFGLDPGPNRVLPVLLRGSLMANLLTQKSPLLAMKCDPIEILG